MLHLERKTNKPEVKIPLETQIDSLRSQLAEKEIKITQLEEENLCNVATLLEQDMRLMDIEMILDI